MRYCRRYSDPRLRVFHSPSPLHLDAGVVDQQVQATLARTRSDGYPTKPVRILVPSGGGSAPDTIARIVADRYSRAFGSAVYVENKPGAGGIINMNALKQAPADGYTLSLIQGAVAVITPLTYKEATYELERDFSIVGMVGVTPMLFASNPKFPAKTLSEAIAAAKAKPDTVALGSSTRASIPNLANELLVAKTGAKFQTIPFATSSQGIQSTIGGDVPMFTDGVAPLMPLVKAGRLRALAVAADSVLPGLEGIPLAKDTVSDLNVYGWFLMVAPKGTSKEIVDRLNKETNEALKQPEVIEKLRELGTYPRPGTVQAAHQFVQSEVKVFIRLCRPWPERLSRQASVHRRAVRARRRQRQRRPLHREQAHRAHRHHLLDR